MKKTAGLLVLFAFCLVAADFWQKPYTDWSDKDLQKMMTNSPWSRAASISMGGPPAVDTGGPAPISEGGGGRGRGGGAAGGGPGIPANQGGSVDIVARWQSAMPVREAFVRLKYGAEADKSADAQKVLDGDAADYDIVLSGPMQPLLRGTPDEVANALGGVTFLSSSRTGAMKPKQIQVSRGPKSMDVLFIFSRSMPFTVEDKEVEFTTRVGTSTLKYKFKLKDMVLNGKLEM